MKKILVFLISILSVSQMMAQDAQNEIKSTIAEGKMIYNLEMANWMSDKVFDKKYKGKETPEGSFSYMQSDKIRTVFYTKGEKPKVIGQFTFDPGFDESGMLTDFTIREISDNELELCKLNRSGNSILSDANEFTTPTNTKLHLIPVIDNGNKKAYVLTEPETQGTVIFGNDYLLQFDNKNKLIDKSALHKNMVAVTYDVKGGSSNDQTSTHVHLATNGDMVTSTDIATLLLYQKLTSWSHHTFISEKNIYFWNYMANELQVVSKGGPKSK